MSGEYTIVHQWDKVKPDFTEFLRQPYEYVEKELKRILDALVSARVGERAEVLEDFRSVVDILEKLNSIYTPRLKS